MKLQRILLTLAIFFSFSLLGQEAEVTPNLKVHEIDGKKYYIHVVEQGNTLYSISRLYSVEVEVLKEENPRLTQALTIGDRLMIPVKEVKRKNLEETVDVDGNFIIHEVQKRGTLYSIAKEYNLEVNDIITANPEVANGLQKGMRLKIPVQKIKSQEQDTSYIEPAAASPYQTHRVAPKETLYSLSKLYDVTVDSILSVNKGLVGGLKVDQLINLPILKVYKDTSSATVVYDSAAVKNEYKVVLLLPLYLDLLDEAQDTSYQRSEELTQELFAKAKYGLEFYKGFQFAADSMSKAGMSLKVEVFDTGHDTAKVRELLKDSALHKADLIIGPLYIDEFMMVSDFAKRHNINIVSPVKQSNKILLGNNFVSKVVTSDPVMSKFLGTYVADSLNQHNVFMVYPDHLKERNRAELIKRAYIEAIQKRNDTTAASLPQEVLWNVKTYSNFKAKWDSTKLNVLIVPSEDRAFVTQLMTMLNLEEDYEFLLMGLSAWRNFDNIEVEYLHNLNVHLAVPDYIDSENEAVMDFEKKFVDKLEIIPEKYSYLGYDVGMYYLSLMNDYGLNFEVMFLGYQAEFLSHKFEFFKTGIESGYENRSVYLVRYKDFMLERIY